MHEPELLILDEPIAGLDPLAQKHFHELLAEVRAAVTAVLVALAVTGFQRRDIRS